MCMMVYLACDYELPEMQWKIGETPLFVRRRNNLKYDQAIELYSHWADNQGKEIVSTQHIYFDTFTLGDSFQFLDECMRFRFIFQKDTTGVSI